MKAVLLSVSLLLFSFAHAQTGDVRGFVYNAENGERISGAIVSVPSENIATVTDAEGFYALPKIKAGKLLIIATMAEFDSLEKMSTVMVDVSVKVDFYLSKKKYIDAVIIDRRKPPTVTNPKITVEVPDILRIPAVGAEPDVIQYLQVLPGVVFSGDQGGQLYIRGGSPVMNRIMLDGLTIYNPFHSIGLYSVFETELIQSADVYTAGFGAEYGGRISAIVDVKTRDGNRNKFRTKVGASTFSSKLLLEGPLKRYKQGQGNASFSVSYRNSYLRQSSKIFYKYASPEKLPYNFGDLFAKLSLNMANGGYGKLYAFHFTDDVQFPGSTGYHWDANGLGAKFLLVPEHSKTRVDGFMLYSNYKIRQMESDNKPRSSSVGGFNLGMNFLYNFRKDNIKWGLEVNGFQTNFEFYNTNNRHIDQLESTTEINGYMTYALRQKKLSGDFGLRAQYYASLGNRSLEPRVSLNYMPHNRIRLKASAGMYSQNLLSAVSDRDVVNLFYGFLSGPQDLPDTYKGEPVNSKLQKAQHLTGGVEYYLSYRSTIKSEAFYKLFTQITNINRDKLFDDDEYNQDKPARLRQNYIVEKGDAYGADISYKYSGRHLYIWAVYSLTWVNRYDENYTYQPNFDRRHNANFLVSYEIHKKTNPTEFSLRWNLGSGFPFTQTQGYFEKFNFNNGLSTNYVNGNGQLGVLYAGVNQGRLPYYHRMDFSARRIWKLRDAREFQLTFSITNLYNRANIFYYDRIRMKRVNQLPILPAIGFTYSF